MDKQEVVKLAKLIESTPGFEVDGVKNGYGKEYGLFIYYAPLDKDCTVLSREEWEEFKEEIEGMLASVVKVFPLFNKKALITRESARLLQGKIKPLITSRERELVLDFDGIEAMAPSFMEGVLTVIDEIYVPSNGPFGVVFLNPPTRLSEKFAAVARAHELSIREIPNGWLIKG